LSKLADSFLLPKWINGVNLARFLHYQEIVPAGTILFKQKRNCVWQSRC